MPIKRTISMMIGKGSINHNTRKFKAENIDAERSVLNISYCNEPIEKVYHELFDEALERYNAKQKRNDRKIDNYYEKIRTGKQEKLFHEVVIQIGNFETMGATRENGELAKQILDQYMKNFSERNPNLRVFSAHLHMDEATPHLHIDFIPFTTGSKRGLDTRVSLKQALAAQGFLGESKGDTEWNRWVSSEKENKLSKLLKVANETIALLRKEIKELKTKLFSYTSIKGQLDVSSLKAENAELKKEDRKLKAFIEEKGLGSIAYKYIEEKNPSRKENVK